MSNILVTGMSGTGKSSVLRELGRRGDRVVDTDEGDWHEWVDTDDGQREFVWSPAVMNDLLTEQRDGTLFVQGCVSNQGTADVDHGSLHSISGKSTD